MKLSRVVFLVAPFAALTFAQSGVPRTADGHPDFTGTWGPSGFADNIAKGLPQGPPMTTKGKDLYEERVKSKGKGDPVARCLPAGVPRADSRPFKLVSTPKMLLVLYEGNVHTFRQIPFAKEHSDDIDPSWYGDSVAHWEGDALVVDTISFNGRTWLDKAGHPASEDLHVIERYTRPDGNHLSIEITVEDKQMYTKPWKVTEVSTLLPKTEPKEYICNEADLDRLSKAGK